MQAINIDIFCPYHIFSGLHFVKYNAKKHDFILLTCLQNALQITSMFSTSSRMEKFWHNRLKPLKLFIGAKKMIFAVYGLTFDLEISTLSFVFTNHNDIEKRKFLINSWLERSLKSQFCINKNVLRLVYLKSVRSNKYVVQMARL